MNRAELLKISKPILFSTPMVRGILEGNKTVTRRVIKLDLGLADMDKTDNSYLYIPTDTQEGYTHAKDLCRYQKGDYIYVRETFRYVSIGEVTYEGECIWQEDVIQFKASQDEFDEKYGDYIGEYDKWKPLIHMRKDLARLFLKVTDVRVERLQDITEIQAENEGITCKSSSFRETLTLLRNINLPHAVSRFSVAWDEAVSKKDFKRYGWESNPFVWVIEFERVVPE